MSIYIFDFCNYISHQKRYSPHTITAYKKDLEQFYDFLSSEFEITSFKDVNSTIIRSWILSHIEKEISTRTINRKISTLKSFFKFLLKNGEVDKNPLLKVVAPKTSKRLPIFVGENETTTLFKEIEFKDGYELIRDHVFMTIPL